MSATQLQFLPPERQKEYISRFGYPKEKDQKEIESFESEEGTKSKQEQLKLKPGIY